MTDGPPIIGYAGAPETASAAAGAPENGRVFTFAPPPVGSQVIFSVAVFVACAVGAMVVAGICLDSYQQRRQGFGYTLLWSGIALAFMAGIVAYTHHDLKRLRKHGQENVRFEISGDLLLARAPQQWGPETRAVELEEIKEIRAGLAADIGRVRIFEIHVRRHRWFTTYWSIRVAIADRGVITRAIADLNRAVRVGATAATAATTPDVGGPDDAGTNLTLAPTGVATRDSAAVDRAIAAVKSRLPSAPAAG
jgi:hypothetical protein